MNAAEIRALTDDELEQAVESAREEMFNLRMQQSIGQISDTSRMRQVRRDMARLRTVRREREIWAVIEAAKGEEG